MLFSTMVNIIVIDVLKKSFTTLYEHMTHESNINDAILNFWVSSMSVSTFVEKKCAYRFCLEHEVMITFEFTFHNYVY